jgi:hypothetical protein
MVTLLGSSKDWQSRLIYNYIKVTRGCRYKRENKPSSERTEIHGYLRKLWEEDDLRS